MKPSRSPARLVLGTAQFGLPYGISNTKGQIMPEEGAAILKAASEAGVCELDTAIAYGNSEQVLGSLGIQGWRVITKLPALPESTADVARWMAAQVSGSLQRLGVQRLDVLLLHKPMQLLSPDGARLYEALLAEQASGRVGKIGISIYNPEELSQLPTKMRFDVVQSPMSLLDSRLIRSGWAARLKDRGTELHARSIFLQGLLLMPASHRPRRFSPWQTVWWHWDQLLAQAQISGLQACLRHALEMPYVDRLVVGVDTAAHLRDILNAMEGPAPEVPPELLIDDTTLLNPSMWT